MKLYHRVGSPNSRRVRIFIAEKGLDIELASVDLGAKEQFSDAYRAINPRSVVPTLVLDDGTAIGEVPAIMRYLDGAFPEILLLDGTPREKALITMWERREELEGFAPVMEGVRNAAAGLKGRAISGPHDYEKIAAVVERSRERVANVCGDFEARLKEGEFVAGDRYSAADITMLVTVDFATRAFQTPIPDDSIALKRWYAVTNVRFGGAGSDERMAAVGREAERPLIAGQVPCRSIQQGHARSKRFVHDRYANRCLLASIATTNSFHLSIPARFSGM
jgi:glutathione S-transferase